MAQRIQNRNSKIQNSLLKWFRRHARDLPWREDRSPYRVWLSEMMLQQTQVETVIPYFHRFLDRFPTIDDLAAAPLGAVLKRWEGLGYYARARNLHKAAQIIVNERHGEWPRSVEGLMALPGIGRYTAGAIASLAFDMVAPVLDGNVIRVLCRVFAIQRDPKEALVREELWQLAETLLPHPPTPSPDSDSPNQERGSANSPLLKTSSPFSGEGVGVRSGEFNEALMELGALVCTPRNPKCAVCPLAKYCAARQRGLQDQLPIKTKRKPLPHFQVTAAVIRKNGRLLIAQRPLGGRLGGLWEFPGGKVELGETLPQCLRREIKEELGIRIKVGKPIISVDHAYTHFKITLHAFECELMSGKPQVLQVQDFKWVRMSELEKYAFAKTDLRIIEALRRDT
ncbi:Adenine DNA glycosylase [Thermoflexales bacterium]|nr:Adenine DNA glycosylase [Thermoflexales bacterium]